MHFSVRQSSPTYLDFSTSSYRLSRCALHHYIYLTLQLSYLDKFRQLITEVGNALGYVRTVRSACMTSAAEAVKFVPVLDLSELPSFEAAAKAVKVGGSGSASSGGDGASAGDAAAAGGDAAAGGAGAAPGGAAAEGKGLSAETLEAARTLDAVLSNLTSSFAEGVDFFRMLVGVFQHVLLRSEKKGKEAAAAAAEASAPPADGSAAAAEGGAGAGAADGSAGKKTKREREDSHLRNFFLIVPALTLSFVDSLRNSKDRMEKSIKGMEAYFTDDGFALGIAYILAILKQDRAFESLHWWDAVVRYHQSELASYAAELATLGKGKGDDDKREELEFKRRRILVERREFEALYFAYRGARTFFRVDDEDDDDEAIALQV